MFQPICVTTILEKAVVFRLGKFDFGDRGRAAVSLRRREDGWWITAHWELAPFHLAEDGRWRYKAGSAFSSIESAVDAFNEAMKLVPIFE